MRQVIVKKNEQLKDESFTELNVSSSKDLVIQPGNNWIESEWPVQVMVGGELNFSFSASVGLATSGIILAGYLLRGDKLAMALYNLGASAVQVKAGTALVTAAAYEPVQMRQVAQEFKDVMILNPEKPQEKKKRGKKRSPLGDKE